jgi:DNA-binding MarR family transcriptional regulator
MKRVTGRTRSVLDALLDLRLELSLLNHRIASESGLNDVDLDCLEVLSRQGPTTPASLTRRLGIHPATMTGILARLEKSGWIERSADPRDRRASVLRIRPLRDARLKNRYSLATQAFVDSIATRGDREVGVVEDVLRELASRARAMREQEHRPGRQAARRLDR